ncbi:hypothetical protein [Oryzomonas rubra]|uniref:Uncharacterized protein n=1 Tax=Oryzomonas rubra TaxID=2509454 RepID=A0A5A9X716_9BACT|nr:hypothetical protein [Oryzomonas rubra]KAA0888760.1 hypothetical protein ET418_15380 [Oryzomonas rubra]
MALTGIEIRLNREEYSRFEPARSVVQARIVPTPATALVSESVVVSIEKKGIPIATLPVTFNGDVAKGAVVAFDLNGITDANGITHINRGDYSITATQGSLTTAGTFKVAMITAAELRKSYCQGLHLVAGLKMAPKRQPSVVTGVVITNVSKSTTKGVKALAWDATAKTLTWDGGVATPITEDSIEEILIDAKGNYVETEIDFYALPDANAAEGILIDQQELTDEFLRSEIEKATTEIEDALKVSLEPLRIATDPYYSAPDQGEYFDAKATSLAYYEKDFNQRGMSWHIDLPYHQVVAVDSLVGYLGDTKALELKAGALTVNRKTGNVDVLPYNSQFAMFYAFFLGMNFWGVREYIANFWRYKLLVGVTDKHAELIKMVGYAASISVLITAEQAYRSGMTNESISKDGVSRSTAYNAQGIYDTTIAEYKGWLKDNIPKYRNLYRGMPCVVV